MTAQQLVELTETLHLSHTTDEAFFIRARGGDYEIVDMAGDTIALVLGGEIDAVYSRLKNDRSNFAEVMTPYLMAGAKLNK